VPRDAAGRQFRQGDRVGVVTGVAGLDARVHVRWPLNASIQRLTTVKAIACLSRTYIPIHELLNEDAL
jgi:hypothetical protein